MTKDDVIDLLRKETLTNQSAWAKANGIFPSYVSDVLNKRRDPSPLILRALGLEKIVSYRKLRTRNEEENDNG